MHSINLTISHNLPSNNINKNRYVIKVIMWTAVWCPPCRATKSYFFSGDKNETVSLTNNIFKALCSIKFSHSKFFQEINDKISLEKKKIMYKKGLLLINKFKNKNIDDLNLEFVNLINKILLPIENLTLPDELTENHKDLYFKNIIYLGIVASISEIDFMFYILDVDKFREEFENENLRSIPTFQISLLYNSNSIISQKFSTSILDRDSLNKLLSDSLIMYFLKD